MEIKLSPRLWWSITTLRFALFKTFSSRTISGLCVSTTTTVVFDVIISHASSDVINRSLSSGFLSISSMTRRNVGSISDSFKTTYASRLFINANLDTPMAAPMASKSGRLCPITMTLSPSVKISFNACEITRALTRVRFSIGSVLPP